jgi:ribosomal RNA-processing protein 17
MFAKPREKKGLLIPPSKKRKTTHAVEEINFDNDARSEYLTGFRKRKQARIKHAQGIAAEKARQEKIELRRQVGNGLKSSARGAVFPESC